MAEDYIMDGGREFKGKGGFGGVCDVGNEK